MVSWSTTNEQIIYIGTIKTSSIEGAGKTGQSRAKKKMTISQFIQKSTQNAYKSWQWNI